MREWRAKIIYKISTAITGLSSLGRVIFFILVALFIAATVWILSDISQLFLIKVPERGGSFTAAMIGRPRLINPVLATSDTDKAMVALVYSGLTRWDPQTKKRVPDLAESWTISPDGHVYTFTLKKGLTFQDGKPLTADDVIFTIKTIQNPDIHSPGAANWAGVRVDKMNTQTIQFTLPVAYAPFIENTNLGILPAHLWSKIPAEAFASTKLNIHPVGSGPFTARHLVTDPTDTPISYSLSPFEGYALGEPYITNFVINFYQNNDEALAAATAGKINELPLASTTEATALLTKNFHIAQFPLPQTFGIFFNQNQSPVLADPTVRQALALAIDRATLIKNVFAQDATSLNEPAPAQFIGLNLRSSTPSDAPEAARILDKAGWIVNINGIREKKKSTGTTPFTFAISTANVPALVATANLLASQWRAIGADVSVKVFESGFEDQVIQPREYDALLFGQDIGRMIDLYPFWASSQVEDPGLNIALYRNQSVDALLADMRQATSTQDRQDDYLALTTILNQDIPALFLFEPHMIDARSNRVAGDSTGLISTPEERFSDVYRWHTETDTVWNIFAHQK